jgi:hypothetical protein
MLNTAILVQDNPLEPRFVIYSAMTGNAIAIHQQQFGGGLGIRLLLLAPNKKLLACGTYESSLVLYNNLT